MEPTAALPRSFSNLSPTPHLDGSQDDNVLPFISRMLMEDDAVDEFYQEYPDHNNPALLQTQQLFAQVLSDTSPSALADVQSGAQGSNGIQDPPSMMNSTATGAVEPANTSSPAEGSSCCKDAVSMAFFRGMEEANKFLPCAGGYTAGRCRGRKKRLDGDDEAEGRASKQMAAHGEESEESAARQMLDQLMLNGDDEPSLLADDMQELRAAMDMAKTAPPGRPAGTRAADQDQQQQAVDLHSMLIRCADAVANNDRHSAADLLERIRRHSSPCVDATQRLAHCFAEGLQVRLNGTGSLHYRSSPSSLVAENASSAGAQLKAQQFFMASCCFLPVTILFSDKTIYSAAAGRKRLHIVHYGLYHGLQWATLLRWLARREGGPPEVRLTGIDVPQPGLRRPARLIEEAGRRLTACARQLGVPFRFRGIAARSEAVRAGDLDLDTDDPDEALVVVSLFHFRTLTDEGTAAETDPVGAVLGAIREMRPSVFVHAVLNASYSTAFFATRFREALYNFSALFDMMDTILPRDNGRRLLFERDVLARCAVNVIACEGADRVLQPRSYKQWQARSRRAGLRQLPLDRGIVRTLRDKARKEYHEHFVVSEDQQWLLQGWKGRVLYAISTWTADNE